MTTPHDPTVLPTDIPVPIDDGAAGHLPGTRLPALTLTATDGSQVDLSKLKGRTVVYIYPRTGVPGQPLPEGWDAIPGARGCTPQSCGFRDHAADLADFGARCAGASTQSLDEQLEFAERERMPFPVIADPEHKLGASLGLPTFTFDGSELYKRVTLVLEAAHIAKVFYPVFPPGRSAVDVIEWLKARGRE